VSALQMWTFLRSPALLAVKEPRPQPPTSSGRAEPPPGRCGDRRGGGATL